MSDAPSMIVVLDERPLLLPRMLRLAWPVFCGQILDMLVGLTDTWLTSRYLQEEHYLAAINQANYVLWFLASLFSLVAIGTTALVARSIGEGNHAAARRLTTTSLWMGAVICLIPAILVYGFGEPIGRRLGLTPESAGLFARYFQLTMIALPAIMIEQIAGAALRAAGDTLSVMIAMIATNVVNLFLSFGMVAGSGPFPQLGWDGIAIGTMIGYYVGAGVMLMRLQFGPSGLKLGYEQGRRGTRDDVRRLLNVGVPGGIDILSLIACQLLFVRLINGLGTMETAAHGIAIRLESLSYLPAFAFQIAATTLVGQFLGARRPDLAKRSVLIACLVGEAFVIVCGTALFHWSDALTALFFKDGANAISELAAAALRIVCVVQPGLVILMILTGALRGAGDTRWPLLNTLMGFLLIRIPLAYVLAYRGIDLPGLPVIAPLGLTGAWYAMAVDLCFRTAMVIWRFAGGRWSRIEV